MTHIKTRWLTVAALVPLLLAYLCMALAGESDSTPMKTAFGTTAIVLGFTGSAALSYLGIRMGREGFRSFRERNRAFDGFRLAGGIVLIVIAVGIGYFASVMLMYLLFWRS